MALDAKIQDVVVKTISDQMEEALEGFTRAFGFPCEMEFQEVKTDNLASAKEDWDNEGLALVMTFGSEGFLFVIHQKDELLPEWCKNPDASGESRMATLSQELGMTLIPEDYMPEDFIASYVPSVAKACDSVGLPENFSRVSLSFSGDGIQTSAFLAWPLTKPKDLKKSAKPAAAPETPAATQPSVDPTPAAVTLDVESSLDRLPSFTRSLLQIQIPMSVRVVSTMKPIGKLLEIGPGSILQFEKNCEDPLILEANNEPIAEGTAVRAGDKFGLQITQILMPRERFWTVQPGKNAG